MATIGTTYTAHTAIGQREDLQDMIYEVSPTETPFMTNAARTSAKAVLHEWQTDSLAAAATANAQIEGDAFSAPAAVPTTRLRNQLQISNKVVRTSNTLDAVDKAGRAREESYQVAKAGRELKRDCEAILTGEHVATAGSIVSARGLAALEAWIVTNRTAVTTNSTGTTPAYGGTPSTALTDGTASVIDETIFKSVIADCWNEGGNPRMIMCGASNKQRISGFSGIATTFKNVPQGQATIVGAADLYVSDFGEHQIVPNRFSRARTVVFLDMEFWAVAFLRPMSTKKLAVTSDSEATALVVEYTLVSRNEAASGKLADLTT